MTKYIEKASNDVLSFCVCEGALASLPGQLDCPWCGCGYLISCSYCRKAFVYARVVEIDATYQQIVEADRVRGGYESDPEYENQQASWLKDAMSEFEIGDIVVYLDGWYLKVDEIDTELDGIFADHSLPRLPHDLARFEPSMLEGTLGDVNYWLSRERPDRGAEDP